MCEVRVAALKRANIPRGINMDQYEGTLQWGAPNFFYFFRSKRSRKTYIFDPVSIVAMLPSHVPSRMQILSTGDGLEGHFQTVFLSF